MTTHHADEVNRGERFAFGDNWAAFLRDLSDRQIEIARESLCARLSQTRLDGLSFLDVGCGSGLFSLAARQLGARVHSFDYDPSSVACARELKDRYFAGDDAWTIDEGSALDADYLMRLGTFDIVYSWGVLHHTGALWAAMENVARLVEPQGRWFLAIYNDQGRASRRWHKLKALYNRAPRWVRPFILAASFVRLWGPTLARDTLRLRPFASWRAYQQERGMHPWRDVVDWVGGYPFEVSRPEEVFAFCHARRFELVALKTCGGGLGCNEFVFVRRDP